MCPPCGWEGPRSPTAPGHRVRVQQGCDGAWLPASGATEHPGGCHGPGPVCSAVPDPADHRGGDGQAHVRPSGPNGLRASHILLGCAVCRTGPPPQGDWATCTSLSPRPGALGLLLLVRPVRGHDGHKGKHDTRVCTRSCHAPEPWAAGSEAGRTACTAGAHGRDGGRHPRAARSTAGSRSCGSKRVIFIWAKPA